MMSGAYGIVGGNVTLIDAESKSGKKTVKPSSYTENQCVRHDGFDVGRAENDGFCLKNGFALSLLRAFYS